MLQTSNDEYAVVNQTIEVFFSNCMNFRIILPMTIAAMKIKNTNIVPLKFDGPGLMGKREQIQSIWHIFLNKQNYAQQDFVAHF